jgi:hypothetical protein
LAPPLILIALFWLLLGGVFFQVIGTLSLWTVAQVGWSMTFYEEQLCNVEDCIDDNPDMFV